MIKAFKTYKFRVSYTDAGPLIDGQSQLTDLVWPAPNNFRISDQVSNTHLVQIKR